MNDNSQNTPTITTQINGRDVAWVTIVENGIPSWVRIREDHKEALWNTVQSLFHKAKELQDEEPTVEIRTESNLYCITFFEYGSVYLSDTLEKRYGKLSELYDDLWDLLENEKILGVRCF